MSVLNMKPVPSVKMKFSQTLSYALAFAAGVVIGMICCNFQGLQGTNSSVSGSTSREYSSSKNGLNDDAFSSANWPLTENSPKLFIFRRTKKTGSSSMLSSLIEALSPLGYEGIYVRSEVMNVHVRNEFKRPHPRRLLVSEHNRVTKAFHPTRSAVIADTLRDGYEQMTSFCRYVRKVPTCDEQLIDCLRSNQALAQQTYRWAGNEEEDDDTYIDLPLSSAHPALSTTVFRTVFPNATLDTQSYNVANSTCPESRELRAVYRSLYKNLDRQVLTLRRRLLVIAGYPPRKPGSCSKCTTSDLLDAAERIEKLKYKDQLSSEKIQSNRESLAHKILRDGDYMVWDVTKDGSLYVKERTVFDDDEEDETDLGDI